MQLFKFQIPCGLQNLERWCANLRLKWLPIDKLLYIYFREAVMTYKCVHNLALTYLCKKLSKRSTILKRSSPNCDSIRMPQFKTACGQRLFTYRAATIRNNLDVNLKIKSLENFKRQFKEFCSMNKDNLLD